MQTVDLVEKTQFDALFTFIFSPASRHAGGEDGRPRLARGKAGLV